MYKDIYPIWMLIDCFPSNLFWYKDSGLWQIRDEEGDKILYQQKAYENFNHFVGRAWEWAAQTNMEMEQELETMYSLARPSNLVRVKVVKDDDGHWYVIPDGLSLMFADMLQRGEEDEWESFNGMFSQYRTGGDINSVKLYAKI